MPTDSTTLDPQTPLNSPPPDATEVVASDSSPITEPVTEPTTESADERETRLAKLTLEDFLVSTLLSRGRAIKSAELNAASEGFSLTRAGLREGLEGTQQVVLVDRDWELPLRLRIKSIPRDQRGRSPLETSLKALLLEIGKPLPVPVIVREVALLRGTYPETIRDAVASTLKSGRFAIEVREGTYFPAELILVSDVPPAFVVRANALENDPDWAAVQNIQAPASGTLSERAAKTLELAGRPLTHKLLGYLLWKAAPQEFDARDLARALGDRAQFYGMLGGYVATRNQLQSLRAGLDGWMRGQSGAAADTVDVGALLRQRLAANAIIAPSEDEIAEVESYAAGSQGHAFSLATILTDVLEMEADDERFTAKLQGLNDALRKSPAFLSAGIGRFLLRASVPEHVGQIPEALRPVHLSVADRETNEPLDLEMSDDGLEGDCAEFIHAPVWEDVAEEVEVKLGRRTEEVEAQTRYIVLNHHFRAGTIKLRRMDEEFFAVEGALSRVSIRAHDAESVENLAVWSSRESGLLYGLGDWLHDRAPQSGATLLFERDPQAPLSTPIDLRLGEPDKLMFLDERRIEELETLRESATYLSIFELLQTIMPHHGPGAELPTLWAEVNAVRRTSKRLLCSVLCAYHCYYFKQRGPKQLLWRFDAGKLDQGFKRNKRKFVRR